MKITNRHLCNRTTWPVQTCWVEIAKRIICGATVHWRERQVCCMIEEENFFYKFISKIRKISSLLFFFPFHFGRGEGAADPSPLLLIIFYYYFLSLFWNRINLPQRSLFGNRGRQKKEEKKVSGFIKTQLIFPRKNLVFSGIRESFRGRGKFWQINF